MDNRIALSGVGCVTPVEQPWKDLSNGVRWYENESHIDLSNINPELNQAKCRRSIIRQMDDIQRILLIASLRSIEDAGLRVNKLNSERMGIVTGTEYGDLDIYETFECTKNPASFRSSLPSTPGLANSIALNIIAPSMTVCGRFSASLEAIVYGMKSLKRKEADIILATGLEKITPTIFERFKVNNALSSSKDCKPFSQKADGFVLSEAAGAVILENEDDLINRGVTEYLRIIGYGKRNGESEKSIINAMKSALNKLDPESIGCVFASANGRCIMDEAEARAIHHLLGDVPVTAIKASTGETLGAGGIINTIAACWSLKNNKIPPVRNYSNEETFEPLKLVKQEMPLQSKRVLVNAIGTNSVSIVLEYVKLS